MNKTKVYAMYTKSEAVTTNMKLVCDCASEEYARAIAELLEQDAREKGEPIQYVVRSR